VHVQSGAFSFTKYYSLLYIVKVTTLVWTYHSPISSSDPVVDTSKITIEKRVTDSRFVEQFYCTEIIVASPQTTF